MTPTQIAPPRCPDCDESVALVEHGYHSSPVKWDASIEDWVTDQTEWSLNWNSTESYWQCATCPWFGDEPTGLYPDEDDSNA